MSQRPDNSAAMRENTDNYRDLFLNDIPLMDVRAPVEFEKGAFPASTNIPLLDDAQRHVIGARYKEQGQDAAIKLGWKLATDEVQAQRIAAWKQHIAEHPEGYLYCFRGGLRSNLSKKLIAEAGINYPLIEGGYKAMRRFLIDELVDIGEALRDPKTPLVLISGRTGSGKTLVINRLSHSVDLEGLARHRGSAFGRQVMPQPAQIDFENALSIAVMKQRHAHPNAPLLVEDEGRTIGGVALPLEFQACMQQAPRAVLETPIEERIDISLADYVTDARPQYLQAFGDDEGQVKFREQILGNLDRIRKRLGGDRHKVLVECFTDALNEFERSDDPDGFRPGIEILLSGYYDPMYDYQQNQRDGREIFRGEKDALVEWAEEFKPN